MNIKTTLSALARHKSTGLHNIKSITNSELTGLPRPEGLTMTEILLLGKTLKYFEIFTIIFIKNLANSTKKVTLRTCYGGFIQMLNNNRPGTLKAIVKELNRAVGEETNGAISITHEGDSIMLSMRSIKKGVYGIGTIDNELFLNTTKSLGKRINNSNLGNLIEIQVGGRKGNRISIKIKKDYKPSSRRSVTSWKVIDFR